MSQSTDPRLADAISLRQASRDEEARLLLRQLHEKRPDDPLVGLQCAWVVVETSADPGLGAYREALSLYSEDLDRTW